MRKILVAGCSPSAPTALTPTAVPTIPPTPIVENPPPCLEPDLIYHTQLQQMLLVNCVLDPSKENPNVIWEWDGQGWTCLMNCK